MAQEGALAERALTTAWDAFEERFSWQSFADLRLLGRLCLCSHVFASVLHLAVSAPAEEEVHFFAVFFDLRAVYRRLLQDEMGVQAEIELAGGSHTPDPGSQKHFVLQSDSSAAEEQFWEGEFGEFLFKHGEFLAPLPVYHLERMWEERLEWHQERMRMHMEDEDIHEMKREKEEVVAEEDAEGAEEDEVITIDTSAAEASEEEDAEETRLLSEEASRGAWDLAMMARAWAFARTVAHETPWPWHDTAKKVAGRRVWRVGVLNIPCCEGYRWRMRHSPTCQHWCSSRSSSGQVVSRAASCGDAGGHSYGL